MNRKIAIFGADGSLGRHVLGAIRRAGKDKDWEAVAITREPVDLPADISVRHARYADANSLLHALEDVDTAIYALPIHRKMEAWNANVIRAADAWRVRRLIRFSGVSADATSSFLPLRLHGVLDDHAMNRQFGQVSILRSNFFMQDFATRYRQMVRDGRFAFAHGEGRISYVDMLDVSSAVVKMLEDFDSYDKQIVEMCGAVSWNGAEVAEIFSDVLKIECTYQALDAGRFKEILEFGGLDEFQIRFIMELQELIQMNEFSFIGEGIYTTLCRRPTSFYSFVMDNRDYWL